MGVGGAGETLRGRPAGDKRRVPSVEGRRGDQRNSIREHVELGADRGPSDGAEGSRGQFSRCDQYVLMLRPAGGEPPPPLSRHGPLFPHSPRDRNALRDAGCHGGGCVVRSSRPHRFSPTLPDILEATVVATCVYIPVLKIYKNIQLFSPSHYINLPHDVYTQLLFNIF